MKILLAKPRGFCAGVERAILCVERAIERHGAPVYVLNDIVHNAAVVGDLAERGAVFVKDLKDVPEHSHVLFSAHGVGPDKWEQARERDLRVIDATCPLVEKVHREAKAFADKGYTVILIGTDGHDEVLGTKGWAPESIKVLFTEEEVDEVEVADDTKVAYVTQTTLSVNDSQRVIDALQRRFPSITGPNHDDICYATQNRQAAVNALAPEVDLVLVVGDRASANSTRLAEICRTKDIASYLISSYDMIEPKWLEGVNAVLLTSGASAPEILVREVVDYLQQLTDCAVEEREVATENVHFKLPDTIT